VEHFERLFVSYHQLQVATGTRLADLPLYAVGDDLVQFTGENVLTVLTGPHTGWVHVRATAMSRPPDDRADGWAAVSEATLWCPEGLMWVCGLMGDSPETLREIRLPRPGLVRVQVRARHRSRVEGDARPPEPREEYEILAWPVTEDVGVRTVRADDLRPVTWVPGPDRAAGPAMVRMVDRVNPSAREANLLAHSGITERRYDRVDVRRVRVLPATAAETLVRRPADFLGAVAVGGALVLPAGPVEARLIPVAEPTEPTEPTEPAEPTEPTEPTEPAEPAEPTEPAASPASFDARWRWLAAPGSTSAVPDPVPSTVEIRAVPRPDGTSVDVTVLHRGVHPADAVLLGLVWEHLLHRAGTLADAAAAPPHPWPARFDEIAEKAWREAVAAQRARDRHEALRWGGRLPSRRVRELPANALGLARLDRGLLDALAEATPVRQRHLARWAARRACTVAGLVGVDWIAAGLRAVEQGLPLPAPLDDEVHAWQVLWADDRVPATTVTSPDGTPNYSQQALALPALFAATRDDPLVAAVDAVHAAACAHGDDHRDLLAAAGAVLAG
jgi:hypothetical protein